MRAGVQMIAWFFFLVYAIATAGLALRAGNASGASSFAVGSGHMNPWVVGVTLGASLASSATFVFYPGWVYVEGLAALIGFSVPLILGLLSGLVLFAPRFQDIGKRSMALTVPHWLGARYDDLALRRMFAGLQVLNVSYLVLITVGCANVMSSALGLPEIFAAAGIAAADQAAYHGAVIGIIAFVFGYTAFGGATAHAFTNTLQGIVMLVVSLVVFIGGLSWFPEAWASIADTGFSHEGSVLYGSWWETTLVPFFVGLALTTQPHLLAKALYVEGRPALRTTIAVGITTYAGYALMLSAGLYARVVLPPGIDRASVVAEYIQVAFTSPIVSAFLSVAILAASMSTLDGLLVAVAASVGNDFMPGRGSALVNRLVLVALAVATLAISWSPPELVLVLGQVGVFGLVAASVGPLVVGLYAEGPLPAWPARAAALIALHVHYGLFKLGVANPGVTALIAILVSLPVAASGLFLRDRATA